MSLKGQLQVSISAHTNTWMLYKVRWRSSCGSMRLIGFEFDCDGQNCRYSHANAPIQKELEAREVGNVAAFLLSPLASAITGSVVYVDNGLNTMGLALDSKSLVREEETVSA